MVQRINAALADIRQTCTYVRPLSFYRGARGKLDPSWVRRVINLTSKTPDANWYDSRPRVRLFLSVSPREYTTRLDTGEFSLISVDPASSRRD